jgi:hypothetical protein
MWFSVTLKCLESLADVRFALKADIDRRGRRVRFVPMGDISSFARNQTV